MGYLHINNLYKDQDILLFKECYALEKLHGSSAHISWNEGKLHFHANGCSHIKFVSLFDVEQLEEKFTELFGTEKVVVYGEAYGGKMQKMKETYGPDLRFTAFDVCVAGLWLSVPQAHDVVNKLCLEFVDYVKISTDLKEIDEQRDAPSVQAIRNEVGTDKLREGVVLRPLIELRKNNDERIIAKHKNEAFKERLHVPKVRPERAVVLSEASAIADEWVIPMRLEHVLQRLPHATGIEHTVDVIIAMVEDVYREAKGEIVESKDVARAISSRTAKLWKQRIRQKLEESEK